MRIAHSNQGHVSLAPLFMLLAAAVVALAAYARPDYRSPEVGRQPGAISVPANEPGAAPTLGNGSRSSAAAPGLTAADGLVATAVDRDYAAWDEVNAVFAVVEPSEVPSRFTLALLRGSRFVIGGAPPDGPDDILQAKYVAPSGAVLSVVESYDRLVVPDWPEAESRGQWVLDTTIVSWAAGVQSLPGSAGSVVTAVWERGGVRFEITGNVTLAELERLARTMLK